MIWAYQFHCKQWLDKMEEALNQRGPWEWTLRDCAWYPDFLQCRPETGARLCIYAMKPPEGPAYHCVAETSDSASRASVDTLLKDLLKHLNAENVKEVEVKEWPFD